MKKKTCIAIVPSPGITHLIPLVEFTKLLVQHHNEFHVKFLIPTLDYPLPPSMQSVLNTLPPSNIDFTILSQVQDLPKNLPPVPKMKLTVKHSIPFLQEALKSLISQTNLVALLFDLFSTDAHDVAKQFNLPSYFFFAPGALVLSSFLSFPTIDKTLPISSQFLGSTYEQVNIPGSVIPFSVKDIPDPFLVDRSSETYMSFLDLCQKISLVDGVIVNTFTDLEPEAIRALQELQKPFVYPIGPIIRHESDSETTNMLLCLEWLNNQPQNSVLYVCFGSVGTLSDEQLNELAFGLEMSGHKFLWVVRPPDKSSYIGEQKGNNNVLEYLPSGFLDRTKEQGLVVPSWAPQIEVLGHRSTGGFLSHCGWSSTLESVVNGVPLIAWPLFAEQKMNAIILTDFLKVAVRPKVSNDDGESGLVKREEVAKAIKRIMEGDESLEICKRMKEISDAAAASLREHGSSIKALSALVSKWHDKCLSDM